MKGDVDGISVYKNAVREKLREDDESKLLYLRKVGIRRALVAGCTLQCALCKYY